MNQEALTKQRFWILFGITVPLLLICMIWLATSVATENSVKRSLLEGHKDRLDANARKDLQGAEYLKLLTKRTSELEAQRLDLWQQAYNLQKDLTVWPGDLQDSLGKLRFGDQISDADRGRYSNFYLGEIGDLARQFEQKFQVGNDAEDYPSVVFKGGWQNRLVQVPKWVEPGSDEMWLAQEDIWVQRELLKAINDANQFVAKFEPVKETAPKDGKPEEVEPNVRFRGKFQNPYWILNLQLVEKGAQFVVRGTIQNRPDNHRQMMVGRLYFAMQISKDGKEAIFPIDGEPLVPGQEWPIREFVLPGLVNPEGILGLRQLFRTRDAAVREIREIVLPYASHRGFQNPPLMPPISLKDVAPAAKGELAKVDKAPKTRNGLELNRYTEVTKEVRRLPFMLLLLVDQAHVPEVLTALANCRLRVQVTQFGWRRAAGRRPGMPRQRPTAHPRPTPWSWRFTARLPCTNATKTKPRRHPSRPPRKSNHAAKRPKLRRAIDMAKKKKLDLKELFLEKGERIGLWVAGLVMAVLVVVGTVSALSNDSPATTVQYIEEKAKVIDQKLASGPVLVEPKFPQFQPPSKVLVPPGAYKTTNDSFPGGDDGDKKRLNPKILMVREGKGDVARVMAMQYMYSIKGRDAFVYVLLPKEVKTQAQPVDPRTKALQDYLERVRVNNGGELPAHIRNHPIVVQLAAANLLLEGKDDFKIELVPLNRIPANAKMARRVMPYRMAIVTAAFPYASQVDTHRRALKEDFEKNPELLPQFLPFQVKRKTLDAQGKVKEDWKELNYEADYGPVLQFATGMEPEDPSMKPLIFRGMVLPRPEIATRSSYPSLQLKLVTDTLQDLARQTGGDDSKIAVNPLEERVRGALNIFEPEPMNVPQPKVEAKITTTKKGLIVPSYCLLRFVDVSVEPGCTYEYQFRVRAANPNEGKPEVTVSPNLAEPKELVGDWGPEQPISVTISQEEFIYAIEMDDAILRKEWPNLVTDRDVAFMQVHKWVNRARVNPEQRNSEVPVGDWVIGSVPVRRGEFVGKHEQTEVPVWFETRERFELAKPPPPPRVNNPLLRPPPPPKGIPIDFITTELLVDYEGGRINQNIRIADKSYREVRDDANVEMLVLSADGKLRVRNSRVDSKDKLRDQRVVDLRRWIEEVRAGNKGKGPDFQPFKRETIPWLPQPAELPSAGFFWVDDPRKLRHLERLAV